MWLQNTIHGHGQRYKSVNTGHLLYFRGDLQIDLLGERGRMQIFWMGSFNIIKRRRVISDKAYFPSALVWWHLEDQFVNTLTQTVHFSLWSMWQIHVGGLSKMSTLTCFWSKVIIFHMFFTDCPFSNSYNFVCFGKVIDYLHVWALFKGVSVLWEFSIKCLLR